MDLSSLIAEHGYWVVGVVVGLESMGIPVPGETTLVAAAIYSGTTHTLSIALVIAAATIGAIAGDNLGFVIGRRYGHPLLVRYGGLAGISQPRIKLGQYLFARHGGKVVFFGRFVAVLRALAALLAGTSRMRWWRFLFFNAAGGAVWAGAYGLAAFALGEQFNRLRGTLAYVGLPAAGLAVLALLWFVRRHEARLQAEAERALPGPLQETHGPGAHVA